RARRRLPYWLSAEPLPFRSTAKSCLLSGRVIVSITALPTIDPGTQGDPPDPPGPPDPLDPPAAPAPPPEPPLASVDAPAPPEPGPEALSSPQLPVTANRIAAAAPVVRKPGRKKERAFRGVEPRSRTMRSLPRSLSMLRNIAGLG